MRSVILIALLMLAFISSGAQHIDNVAKPAIMLDSVQMPYNSINQLNPSTVKSMNTTRNNKFPDGVIYMTLKDPSEVQTILKSKQLSLQQLADKYIEKADKGKPILYVMNDKLVTDTSNVRILSDGPYNITVLNAKYLPYFKTAFPKALLLMVQTTFKIMIR